MPRVRSRDMDMGHNLGMDHSLDMVDMEDTDNHRDNTWTIGGAEVVGLWRRCWLVWLAAVAWRFVVSSEEMKGQ